VDEAERSVHDAIMAVKDVVEYPYIIAGGGAPEALAAARIRDWAGSLSGRMQIAVYKFADALETLPLTLAENAGMDLIDAQVHLRAKVAEEEGRGENKARYGIDVLGAKVVDISRLGIIEPLVVKEQVINAATEAASMILRIDDVISASRTKTGGAGRVPGGIGG
jgi:archaeal chaperonin